MFSIFLIWNKVTLRKHKPEYYFGRETPTSDGSEEAKDSNDTQSVYSLEQWLYVCRVPPHAQPICFCVQGNTADKGPPRCPPMQRGCMLLAQLYGILSNSISVAETIKFYWRTRG